MQFREQLNFSRAHRLRKALGGGMRQTGVLAAAALVSLDTIVPGINTDHEKLRRIAEGNLSFLLKKE